METITKRILDSRADWLASRGSTIGGSEAAAVVGLNPYMTNVDLWRIKTGAVVPEGKENEAIIYGRKAEEHIRELFKLDHPEMTIWYEGNNLFLNQKYPFAHASVDSLARCEDGRGVIEYKTATISSSSQKAKWDKQIPDNYFVQILHYMAVLDADFAILRARLRWLRYGSVFVIEKEYRFNREEFIEDIEYLMEHEEKFYQHVLDGTQPPLVLPQI